MAHTDGLHFRKLDLHLHTPASKCFGDLSVKPEDIVRVALERGLDGIAITDHNSGAWIDVVKEAAKGTSLVIIPGVELTCMGGKEGLHLIALFDPSCNRVDIEALLGELKLLPEQYGDITTVIHSDPISIAEVIEKRRGLTVLAHANSSRGVLQDMRGQQRIQLIQSPYIHAAEGTDFQEASALKAKKRVVDLLDGTDPEYCRKLAVYQASDNPTGKGDGTHALAGIGTRCSFFKIDQIDIDGLRQCFHDPDVRIRQDFEFTTTVYPQIESIEVVGGFLDQVKVTFHTGLNSILGSKGAGKSLLIEFLRFVLNQAPTNPEILADHEGKLQYRLDDYGSVHVKLSDETGKSFEIKRAFIPSEQHPYAEEGTTDIAQLFPVMFLSQNEIIKIAESESEQIAFIDRFFDFRKHQQTIKDIETQIQGLGGIL